MSDQKARVIRAMELYVLRQGKLTKSTGRRRKNKSPEKEVEKACMRWMRENGFLVNVVESKAVYNARAQRYLRGQTSQGFSDVVGITPCGRACFIELKAPGRISTLKEHQAKFLSERKGLGAFAVCVDSVELLKKLYGEFRDGKV